MVIYYVFLFIAALLYAFTFYSANRFQKLNGTALKNGLVLAFVANLFIAIAFLIKGSVTNLDFHFPITWLSGLLTFLMALCTVGCILLCVLILKSGRMSYYSIFMMAGAMTLPSITGMVFFNEKVSALKIVLIVFMVAICFYSGTTVKEKTGKKKGIYLLFASFLLNGIKNSILTVYNYNPTLVPHFTNSTGAIVIDNDAYMTTVAFMTFIVAFIAWIIVAIKKRKSTDPLQNLNKRYFWVSLLLIPFLYGLFCGVGDFLLSSSTGENALNASIVFPLNSGATILFSALIGIFLLKEKLNWKKAICLVLMIGCTVGFLFV